MEWLNIYDYEDPAYPFQIFIGARGVGKTYSALYHAPDRGKFIYMRRTQAEMDLILDNENKGEGINPFKPINKDRGLDLGFAPMNKKLAGVYHRTRDKEMLHHEGAPIGYGLALTSVSGIRGIDLSDVKDVIYDEFIPELHVKRISGEAEAFFNAYETIGRNREFFGEDPLRVWMLANSNDIYNPIFVGMGIVRTCEQMINKKQYHFYDAERGLAIHILPPAESYVEAKRQTALYKLTTGTQFAKMALGNAFSYNDFSLIGWTSLQGYKPVCALDNAYIWRHDGLGKIYITYASAKVQTYNSSEKQDVMRFNRMIGQKLRPYYERRDLLFESYEIKEKILTIIL